MKELKDTITTAAEPCTENGNQCTPKIDGDGKADFAKQSAEQGGSADAMELCTENENKGKPVSIILKEIEERTYDLSLKGDYERTLAALQYAIVPAFLNYTCDMDDEVRLIVADSIGAEVGRLIRKRLLKEDTDGNEAEEEKACKPKCKGCCHGCGEEHTEQP